VRGHTVVRVLKQRWPNRPVDLLVTSLCAPLVDYMPGVRTGIVWDLPRSRLALARQWGLAAQLRARNYGTALILPRTWKSAMHQRWPVFRNGGVRRRSQVSGCSTDALGREGLPRFIDKNAASGAAGTGRRCRPEWPVRSSTFPPRNRPLAQSQWAGTVPAVALLRARSGRPSAWTYLCDAARLLAQNGLMCGWWAAPVKRALAQRSSPRVDLAFAT